MRPLHRLPPVTPDPIRVLLCEDHEIYRVGLRVLIEGEPDLVVVGETEDVWDACALAGRVSPQVVVIRQGLLEGHEDAALGEICALGGAVLVLAECETELELVRALRAGARGYLARRLAAPRLLDGIRALARDEPALDPAVARHLMRYLTDGQRDTSGVANARVLLQRLTERQRAVALLAAEGLTNDEIAARLYLTQATVKSHLTAILRRLSIHNRTQLAILVNRDVYGLTSDQRERDRLG
jgi:DNA-binding NarL/FixJ family response regulator